jgi:hypothetical protein
MQEISMKSIQNRILAIVGLGLFAVCAFAAPTLAQGRISGSFTLPHEVRWQSVTLPAGDYTFSQPSVARTSPMTVTGPNGSVFELAAVISERHADKPSVLVLQRFGGTYFVREIYLDTIGVQLDYWMPKIPKNEKLLAQGPASTEQILISVGK